MFPQRPETEFKAGETLHENIVRIDVFRCELDKRFEHRHGVAGTHA